MKNTIDSNQLDVIKKSLETYLVSNKNIDFLNFIDEFTKWFSRDSYDNHYLTDEERDILNSVIKNNAYIIFDNRTGLQHPISYPFVKIIESEGKSLISFSQLFFDTLDHMDEKQIEMVVDKLLRIRDQYEFTGFNISKLQYYMHKHLFRRFNNEYEIHFAKDFESLLVTDQFLNLYDEVLNEIPELKNEPNSKKTNLFKDALKAKLEFGKLVHGFNIGKIIAAHILVQIYRLSEKDTKLYFQYELHKRFLDILKPHELTYTYDKNKNERFITYIKEFSNLDINQLIKEKNYNSFSVLLPYLSDVFKDNLFNSVIDHSDLLMVKTFLQGGAFYFKPVITDDGSVFPSVRDTQKTMTMLAMLEIHQI
jgi:hypothetical protein